MIWIQKGKACDVSNDVFLLCFHKHTGKLLWMLNDEWTRQILILFGRYYLLHSERTKINQREGLILLHHMSADNDEEMEWCLTAISINIYVFKLYSAPPIYCSFDTYVVNWLTNSFWWYNNISSLLIWQWYNKILIWYENINSFRENHMSA